MSKAIRPRLLIEGETSASMWTLQPEKHYRVRYAPTRRVLPSAQSSTSFAMKAALGRSNAVNVMSTIEAIMRWRSPFLALATVVFLLELNSPVFADGNCGPLRGGGTGCTPT